jgi:hypothetical protein
VPQSDRGRLLSTHEEKRNGQRQSEGQPRSSQTESGEAKAASLASVTVRGASGIVAGTEDWRQEGALMRHTAAIASVLKRFADR